MKILTTAAVIALLSAPLAHSETYTCAFKPKGGKRIDWIPAQVQITKTAEGYKVIDPVINHFFKAPIPAQVDVDNDKRITFKWELDGAKSAMNEFAHFSYRMTSMKGKNSARIDATPKGYANRFEGVGNCNVK